MTVTAPLMRLLPALALAVLLVCSGQTVSAQTQPAAASATTPESKGTTMKDGLYAKIKTGKGDILLELFYDKTPLTVINFVGLAEGTLAFGGAGKAVGTRFYDGLKFHRVIKDFMIQGGCPLGTGTGGPGYTFADEILPGLKFTGPGILAMANAGPATNGSQFFITHVATPHLNGKHTIFGQVAEGQNVVDAIKQGDVINGVEIIRQGEKARQFQADQAAFDQAKAALEAKHQTAAAEGQKKIMQLISKRWPSVQSNKEGLRWVVTKAGQGATPAPGARISVHYTGRLLENDRKFDSSYDRGEPIQFEVGSGQVIPGWDMGLISMKKGEQRTLIIPPNLAYGERGAGGGIIPPNAWLVFDVELVGF
ncbi:peptidylprolyl isomerase [Candidatus Electronema sp. TJ]|uniref:peptidylprolyl isomerase n=1 Tax=Candidatus Electronema sp. TJ TaxID=3401573 RepID=UPI003AA83627